jgi:hypothetical protein
MERTESETSPKTAAQGRTKHRRTADQSAGADAGERGRRRIHATLRMDARSVVLRHASAGASVVVKVPRRFQQGAPQCPRSGERPPPVHMRATLRSWCSPTRRPQIAYLRWWRPRNHESHHRCTAHLLAGPHSPEECGGSTPACQRQMRHTHTT